ncbi:MAG TPA: hypothetical protein VFP72_13200 [Kineosporiaceae bacterium]|nr:hypothetical protein [Kineosporiaceae bacterium]
MATTGLKTSLDALGRNITISLRASGTTQVREQLGAQADQVRSEAQALVAAVTAVPATVKSQAESVRTELGTQAQAVQASTDKLRAAAGQAHEATNASAAATSLQGLSAKYGETRTATETFTTKLKQTATQASATAREAFAAAPACAPYVQK